MRYRALVFLCLGLVFAAGCKDESSTSGGESTSGDGGDTSAISIAVIPKGTTHVFWKSIEAGARKASDELDVEMIWKGPLKENDRAQQISIVDQFVAEGLDGIVLAPLDDTALVRPVQGAMGKKIPVVIIDSALKGESGKDFVSLVATNNKQAGVLAGEQLAKLLDGKGKVVMLKYQEGSASTMDREAGFAEVMARHPEIEITVSNRYAGATAGEAKDAALNMLDRLTEADGIFTSNESATFGMLLALRQNNLAGTVNFVGFDGSPQLIEGLQKGEINALVVQNPTRMGYEGVKTLISHMRGEQVPAVIDTGAQVVTQQNLNDPEIKALLGTE